MNNTHSAKLCILGTAFLWSTMGLLYKLISCSAMTIVCLKGLVAFICYGLFLGSFRIPMKRELWLGAFLAFSSSTLFTLANKLTTAGNAIVLQYTNPIVIVLVCWLFLKQAPSRADIIMTLVVSVGILLFFADDLAGGNMLGNGLALASGVFLGLGTIYASRVPPAKYYMISELLAFIMGLPSAIKELPTIQPADVLLLFLLGCFSVFAAGVFFTKGMKYVEPLTASIILMLDPILNPVWVALFVGEIPGPMSLIGAAVVLSGITYRILRSSNAKAK